MNPASDKNSLLKEAFDRFHDGMVFYAFQYLDNGKDSEDIVQELYVKLWETELLFFENEKALKTYLYRMVRNACINKLGRKDALKYAIDIINEEVREERYLTFDEAVIAEIVSEIGRLPLRTRRVFTAVFLEGKKYREAADELGISVNTVKTLLKNGVKQLRKRFAGRESLLLSHLIFVF